MVDLSVVIPVYNERDALPVLEPRLRAVLDGLPLAWEVLFVDDGSTDGTPAWLLALHQRDPRFGALLLSRNFGHQVALTAGLAHARGRAAVSLDADLQDPPELIPALVARWQEGADVVLATRTARDGEGWFKRATAAAFYRLVNALAPIDLPLDTGDFRLLSRAALDALNALPERNRYVRGLVAWIGLPTVSIPYDRAPRAAGHTKYPLRRMFQLAGDAIVSFSTVPLRLATLLGFVLSVACFVYAAWAAYGTLIHAHPVPGWASMIVAVLLIGGVQLVCLGIIGEYIGRIYDETKQRPQYVVVRRELAELPSGAAPTPRVAGS